MKYVDMLVSVVFAAFVLKVWWGGFMLVPMVLALGRIGLSVAIWKGNKWILWYTLIYIFLVAYDYTSSSLFDSVLVVVPLVKMTDAVCRLFTGQPDTFYHDYWYTSNKDTGLLIAYVWYVWLLVVPLAYGLWLALHERVYPSLKSFCNKWVVVFLCVSVIGCLIYNDVKQVYQLSALWVWVLSLAIVPLVSSLRVG